MNLAITNGDINTKSPETKPVAPMRETELITIHLLPVYPRGRMNLVLYDGDSVVNPDC